jgi:hypothetical protein
MTAAPAAEKKLKVEFPRFDDDLDRVSAFFEISKG